MFQLKLLNAPARRSFASRTILTLSCRHPSNRPEDHEISMLALHLIQNCMVYINTLMIQKVLAQPHWHGRLTPRDYAALTPLIWEHVNPYGRFDLDMNARLELL